jgi:hypothetical protein
VILYSNHTEDKRSPGSTSSLPAVASHVSLTSAVPEGDRPGVEQSLSGNLTLLMNWFHMFMLIDADSHRVRKPNRVGHGQKPREKLANEARRRVLAAASDLLTTLALASPLFAQGSLQVKGRAVGGRSDKQVGKSQSNKSGEADVDKAENPPVLRCVAFRELPGHELGERV